MELEREIQIKKGNAGDEGDGDSVGDGDVRKIEITSET